MRGKIESEEPKKVKRRLLPWKKGIRNRVISGGSSKRKGGRQREKKQRVEKQ